MPGASTGGGNALGGTAMSGSSASLAADVESRVAAEMRANRAETEAASLKQQVGLTAANNVAAAVTHSQSWAVGMCHLICPLSQDTRYCPLLHMYMGPTPE